jgi:hypothetical protein
MAEKTETDKKQTTALLNAYYGTVDPASIVEKKDKAEKTYLVAKLDVHGPEKTVDLYVRGKTMEAFRAKVEAGGQIFVQGETLAKGKAISVSSLEPKSYEAKITKIHKTGTNDYGDWTAAKVSIDGMQNERNVILSGADARAANEAGEGGTITFKGAWKPSKNEETGAWYSRLSSASALEPRSEEVPAPTP